MKKFDISPLGKQLHNSEARKATVFQFAYWFFTIMFLEGILYYSLYEIFGWQHLYVVGFSAVIAGILSFVLSFVARRWQFFLMLLITLMLVVFYGSQVVYDLIFGTFYSASQMQMGAAAVTSFWNETIATIGDNLLFIGIMLLPVFALIGMGVSDKERFTKSNWLYRAVLVVAVLLINMAVLRHMSNQGTGYFTDYYYYHAKDATVTQTAERFGLITAFRLELFGTKSDEIVPEEKEPENKEPVQTATEVTEPEDSSGTEMPTEPLGYNILDIDFEELNEKTEDETIREINDYVATLTGTQKNEYTGMLHDYNLIMICAESFATGAIDQELTPTLYRLANEGIIFNNYYNAFPNNTTDGEYSLVVGLNPDGSREKVGPSFYASRNSYLPFTLGKVFSEQAGIQPYGYHNYVGTFYARNETHPNLGYQMKFNRDGMVFSNSGITSDLEMVEQTVDDYIGQEQFHAYYMTYSGHYRYDKNTHAIAQRNWGEVRHLTNYTEAARAYLACNIELDKALEYLMRRLEEAGIADRTAIVLAGDHFPYGLNDREYSKLVGYEIDKFSKYKSTLIFWVGGLEENIVVDEYCCNVDVLPTILNLWGFQFDSRLLAGTDVFSDGPHIAVRVDKSFYTDKMWLDANTGTIKYLVDESEIPDGYVESIVRLIQDRLDLSVNILNSAYYNFLFDKGDIEVDRKWWAGWEAINGGNKEKEEIPEEGETPDPGIGGETPDPGTGGETPNPGTGGETPDPGTGGETPDPGTGGERPDPGTGGETPDPGTGGETPNPGTGGETPPPAADAGNSTE